MKDCEMFGPSSFFKVVDERLGPHSILNDGTKKLKLKDISRVLNLVR